MKIISILGSPKGLNGYTGFLLRHVLEAARESGAETQCFSLGEFIVRPCKGCQEICHVTGFCHQQDDFENIKNAMLEAEGIIFATPNYCFSVTAQLKALLDRCNLLLHCQNLNGKYGAVVVTSGGSDPEMVENYLSSIMTHHGFWKTGELGAVRAQFEDTEEKTKLAESARSLGIDMVKAIKDKKTFAEQAEDRNQAFEIMKYMVMMLRKEWPFAWDYWNTHWEIGDKGS